MLAQLSTEIALPLEPTYDELNPPLEPEKEYRFSLGDTVYLGTAEYEILSFDGDTVLLFDPAFPIINKELPRAEFDERLKENPLNDHLLVEVLPAEERTENPNTTPIGDDDYYFNRPDRQMFEAVYCMLGFCNRFKLFQVYATGRFWSFSIFQRGISQNAPSAFQQYGVHLNKSDNGFCIFTDNAI